MATLHSTWTPLIMSDIAACIAIPEAHGPVQEHSYIVKLKQGINKEGHLGHVQTHISSRFVGECECEVTHPSWNRQVFNGYAGKQIFSYLSINVKSDLML